MHHISMAAVFSPLAVYQNARPTARRRLNRQQRGDQVLRMRRLQLSPGDYILHILSAAVQGELQKNSTSRYRVGEKDGSREEHIHALGGVRGRYHDGKRIAAKLSSVSTGPPDPGRRTLLIAADGWCAG